MDINIEEYDGRLALPPEDFSDEVEDLSLSKSEEDRLGLSPRQTYPKPEALDNYFICKVCLKVLTEPKECSTCQTAFCSDCID